MKFGHRPHGHDHDGAKPLGVAELHGRIKQLEDRMAALDETFKKNDLVRRVADLEKK
jgi:hypothetical protein